MNTQINATFTNASLLIILGDLLVTHCRTYSKSQTCYTIQIWECWMAFCDIYNNLEKNSHLAGLWMNILYKDIIICLVKYYNYYHHFTALWTLFS